MCSVSDDYESYSEDDNRLAYGNGPSLAFNWGSWDPDVSQAWANYQLNRYDDSDRW